MSVARYLVGDDDTTLIAGLAALVARQDAELARLRAQISDVVACDACGATWHADEGNECRWCARRRQRDDLLTPPAPRGYGHATHEDLARLGFDPAAERAHDLRRWADDLRSAAELGLVDVAAAEQAIRRAEKRAA